MRVENVNIEILRETASRLDTPSMSKFPKLQEWVEGTRYPTFNQLTELANTANIPFGYFFLDELPERKYPIPHYRTQNNEPFTPSHELLDTLDIVKQRQDWAKDILLENGAEPLPFAGNFTPNSDPKLAAETISTILGATHKWAFSKRSWTNALFFLIKRAEESGIFVVMNGVVGSNTKRSLTTKEFRGFVLYDDIAPFVFINGKDSIAGKIFTLIHEIAHVLIGESASFDLFRLTASDNNIEQFCDQVAAEFLVPTFALAETMNQYHTDDTFELASLFKVSEIVIARRLLDLGYMTKPDYFDFYEDYIKRVQSSKKAKGGNYYNTAPYKISRRFFNLINQAAKQGNVQYTDAFRLTGLNRRTYDRYIKEEGL
jgi:Zn-dependent peptidase ImmA (M78 family)